MNDNDYESTVEMPRWFIMLLMTACIALMISLVSSGSFKARDNQKQITRCINGHQGSPDTVAECWSSASIRN